MSLSGLKDIDREFLKHVDDKELLEICTINKKTWNEVCDDAFLRRRLVDKYPGIEKHKRKDESWKRFFLSAIYYISKLKEDYQFPYSEGDFKNQYRLFKNESGLLFLDAIDYEQWSIVKYLIGKGHNIHAFQDYAIRIAAAKGDMEMTKWLVERGADINAWQGFVLINPIRNGHFEVAKYLIKQGSDIHAQGDEALKAAVENGDINMVKYLVEHGANIHVDEDLPLRIAQQHGFTEISAYLQSRN